MATPLLAFLAIGLASQSLAGELAQGTLRNLLLRPIGRGTVLLGKLLALSLATVASFTAAALVAVSLTAATLGFGDAVEVTRNGDRSPLIAAPDIAPHLTPALLSAIAPLLCYVTLGLCLSALVRRPTVALALAFGLGASLDLSRGLLPEAWLPSAYLPAVALARHLPPARLRRPGLRPRRRAVPRRRAGFVGGGRVGGGRAGVREFDLPPPRCAVRRGRLRARQRGLARYASSMHTHAYANDAQH